MKQHIRILPGAVKILERIKRYGCEVLNIEMLDQCGLADLSGAQHRNNGKMGQQLSAQRLQIPISILHTCNYGDQIPILQVLIWVFRLSPARTAGTKVPLEAQLPLATVTS